MEPTLAWNAHESTLRSRGSCELAHPQCCLGPPCRLAATALKALAAPAAEVRRLAEAALQLDFPAARMLQRYDCHWARLHAFSSRARRTRAAHMTEGEAKFYGRQVRAPLPDPACGPDPVTGRLHPPRQWRPLGQGKGLLRLSLCCACARVPPLMAPAVAGRQRRVRGPGGTGPAGGAASPRAVGLGLQHSADCHAGRWTQQCWCSQPRCRAWRNLFAATDAAVGEG